MKNHETWKNIIDLTDKLRIAPDYDTSRELSWQIIYMGSDVVDVEHEVKIRKYELEAKQHELTLKYKSEKIVTPLKSGEEKLKDKYTIPEVEAKVASDLKEEYLELMELEHIAKKVRMDLETIRGFSKVVESALYGQLYVDKMSVQ